MTVINVAHIIDTLEYPTAGTEKQLLLMLDNFDKTRFSHYLCCLRDSDYLNSEFSSCPLFISGDKNLRFARFYFLNALRMARFLREKKIDIANTYFREGNIIGILASKLAGVKYMVSSRRGVPYWKNAFELFFHRRINSLVDAFVANSLAMGVWLEWIENVPPGKIRVIHNGLDIEKFHPSGFENVQNGPGDGVNKTVGIVANLRKVKGIEVFIKAAKVLSEALPDLNYVIVGEGPERGKLERLSVELGIADKVNFLGRCRSIPELLREIDIGVLSSYYESFSNSILEYMAMGLPVVCTDVGGAREVISQGENGFLVPPGDHLGLAMSIKKIVDGNLFSQFGSVSRSKIEKGFTKSVAVSKMESLYLNLMNGGRQR
jgi:L-malate glycosyltransferase